MTHRQAQEYSHNERPPNIVRYLHQHGFEIDFRRAVLEAVLFASFIAYQLTNNERAESIHENRSF